MVYTRDRVCFNSRMEKQKAIELLGGTVRSAADAIGISYQAVKDWPEVLPPRIADRVEAAAYRALMAESMSQPQPEKAAA